MMFASPSRRVRCQDTEWLAVLWLDGELDEPLARRFEAHVGSCERCRGAVEELRRSGTRWSSALRVPVAGARPLADRVLDAVDAERARLDALRRTRPKRILAWSMAGAAAAIALVLTCLLPMPALMDPLDLSVTVPAELVAGGNTKVRVAVRDYHTGRPAEGRRVRLAAYEPGARSPAHARSAVTDPYGIGVLDLRVPDAGRASMRIEVQAENAFGDSRVELQVPLRVEEELLVNTGRPLYQPGQEATIQARLLRVPGRTPVWGGPVSIVVLDPLGRCIYSGSDAADEFGGVSFSLPLATELTYGRYEVRAAGQSAQAGSSFQVRPYVTPPFDATVTLASSVYRRDAPVSGVVTARYGYGQAIPSAPVTVRMVVDSDTVGSTGASPLAQASGMTDGAGRYSFSLPAARQTGRVRVEAVVTDSRGAQVVASAGCSLVDGRPRIAAMACGGALVRGLPGAVYVMLSNGDGSPAVGRARVSLLGPTATPLGEKETDADGAVEFPVLATEDSARLRVTATLADGATVTEVLPIAVGGPESMAIRTDKAVYRAGDAIDVNLTAGGPPGDIGVDVVRAGQVLESYTVEAVDRSAERSLLTDSEMAGVLLLHGYRLDRPEVSASSLFVVEPVPSLAVEIGFDRNDYQPGDNARLRVRTENRHGFPVSAALDLVGLEEGTARALRQDPALSALYFAMRSGWVRPRDPKGTSADIDRLVYEWASGPEEARRGHRAQMLLAACDAPVPRVSTIVDPAGASYDRALERRNALLKLSFVAGSAWLAAMIVWMLVVIAGARRPGQESVRERATIPTGATILVIAAAACVGLAHALSQGGALDAAPPSSDSACMAAAPSVVPDSSAVDGAVAVRWSPFDAAGAGFVGPGRHSLSPEALAFPARPATDAQGWYGCDLALPRAEGAYVVSALALGPTGEIGWAETRIEAQEPIPCRATLPDRVVVGQRTVLHVQVDNATDSGREVNFAPEPASWYAAEPAPGESRQIVAHSRLEAELTITPSSAGEHELKLVVSAGSARRTVAVPVRVDPVGALTTSCVSGGLSDLTHEQVFVDPSSDEGSRDIELVLVPDANAHALQALAWAEKTESSSAGAAIDRPALAAAVVSAFRAGEAGAKAAARAEKSLTRGYQTFLARRPTVGTDAYIGEPTAERAALELLTLQHLRQLDWAPASMVAAAQKALCALRGRDGTFRATQTSTSPDTRCIATAGAAWALASSGYRGPELARAVDELLAMLPAARDPYALALGANALLAARSGVSAVDDVARRLAGTMQPRSAGAPWHAAGAALDGATGADADAETAALIVLALDARSSLGSRTMEPGVRTLVDRAIRRARSFIVSSKTIDGVWATPYLTSLALDALATANPMAAGDASAVSIVVDGKTVGKMDLADRAPSAVVRVPIGDDMHPGLNTVAVESEGRARGDYLLTTRYYVRGPH